MSLAGFGPATFRTEFKVGALDHKVTVIGDGAVFKTTVSWHMHI